MLITFFFFLLSLSQDENYMQSRPYPCGTIGNINYPFWSEIHPSYCGNPITEFKLYCPTSKDEFPIIQIRSQTFNVKNIDYSTKNMNLVRYIIF